MNDEAGSSAACYFCGSSIRAEPPGRLDQCANCSNYIHACRMCVHYDPTETSKQCREDDAEEVRDKRAANFCDYFRLASNAYDDGEMRADSAARAGLAALFGDTDTDAAEQQDPASDDSRLLNDAEALFRK